MYAVRVDTLDRKLLYELDSDSRQSLSQLARVLREGRDRVSYRVERLVREGVIRQFTVVINPYRLGYTLYKTYLKVSKQRGRYEGLIKLLRPTLASTGSLTAMVAGIWYSRHSRGRRTSSLRFRIRSCSHAAISLSASQISRW